MTWLSKCLALLFKYWLVKFIDRFRMLSEFVWMVFLAKVTDYLKPKISKVNQFLLCRRFMEHFSRAVMEYAFIAELLSGATNHGALSLRVCMYVCMYICISIPLNPRHLDCTIASSL